MFRGFGVSGFRGWVHVSGGQGEGCCVSGVRSRVFFVREETRKDLVARNDEEEAVEAAADGAKVLLLGAFPNGDGHYVCVQAEFVANARGDAWHSIPSTWGVGFDTMVDRWCRFEYAERGVTQRR